MTDQIRVAIIDDHPLFRAGVLHCLSVHADITVVAEGATAEQAVALAHRVAPDVILMDLHMPGDIMKALEAIAAVSAAINVLMLTVVADERCVAASLRRGARGYILKGVSAAELANTIRVVSRREMYVTPGLAVELLCRSYVGPGRRAEGADPFAGLTERERQVLALVSEAMSNKEIARRIELTEKTVKHHLTSILKKLQVKNRVEAALLASRRSAAGMDGEARDMPLRYELL